MADLADSSLGQAVASSDIPETVASGIEGFYKGAFPKGSNDLLEKHLGGATQEQIDTREAEHPFASNIGQFAGGMLKDIASATYAGPLALYGNAYLNNLTNTANRHDNADPTLTFESMSADLGRELLLAGAGQAGGAIAGKALDVGGKVIMKAASKVASAVSSGPAEAAEEALRQGVFSKGRVAAADAAYSAKADIEDKFGKFLEAADEATSVGKSEGAHVLYSNEIQDTLKALGSARKNPVRTELNGILKEVSSTEGHFTPSKMVDLEERLDSVQELARKSGDTNLTGHVSKLQMRVQKITDDLLANQGVSPDQVREFQRLSKAQDAVIAMIPKQSLGDALKTVGARALAVGAAHASGIPYAGAIASAAFGLNQGARKAYGTIGKAVINKGAQVAYNLGQVASEFDRGVFAQYIASKTQQSAAEAASAALSSTARQASDALKLPESILPILSAYEQNPQMYLKHAQDSLDKAPLSQSDKNNALEANQMLLQYLQVNKPRPADPSPFAPAGARAIPKSAQLQFNQKVQGALNPIETLKNPTQAGLDAVRILHPTTYAAYVNALMQKVGPNTASSGKARRLLGQLGLDNSTRQAGFLMQQVHAQQNAAHARPAPKPKRGGTTNNNSTVINSSATALDKVEGSEQ